MARPVDVAGRKNAKKHFRARQVRAFTGKRGKRVDWASMCDRMSQIAAATRTTLGQDGPAARDTVGGVLSTRRTPYSPQEPRGDDDTMVRAVARTTSTTISLFSPVSHWRPGACPVPKGFGYVVSVHHGVGQPQTSVPAPVRLSPLPSPPQHYRVIFKAKFKRTFKQRHITSP